jgi:hypothetical protein
MLFCSGATGAESIKIDAENGKRRSIKSLNKEVLGPNRENWNVYGYSAVG